jgi:hypothetical protein
LKHLKAIKDSLKDTRYPAKWGRSFGGIFS